MFGLSVNSASKEVFLKKASSVLTHGGVNSFACSNNVLKSLVQGRAGSDRKTKKHFLFSKVGFSSNAGLMTLKPIDHETLNLLGPNVAILDRYSYSYDAKTLYSTNYEAELSGLDSTITTQTLFYAVVVRQILINLTLLHIARKPDSLFYVV